MPLRNFFRGRLQTDFLHDVRFSARPVPLARPNRLFFVRVAGRVSSHTVFIQASRGRLCVVTVTWIWQELYWCTNAASVQSRRSARKAVGNKSPERPSFLGRISWFQLTLSDRADSGGPRHKQRSAFMSETSIYQKSVQCLIKANRTGANSWLFIFACRGSLAYLIAPGGLNLSRWACSTASLTRLSLRLSAIPQRGEE